MAASVHQNEMHLAHIAKVCCGMAPRMSVKKILLKNTQ